jgi:hypothetical protein
MAEYPQASDGSKADGLTAPERSPNCTLLLRQGRVIKMPLFPGDQGEGGEKPLLASVYLPGEVTILSHPRHDSQQPRDSLWLDSQETR